jgi:hypothetical protein
MDGAVFRYNTNRWLDQLDGPCSLS